VPEVLGEGSNLAEVLWNFSRYHGEKRITLKQNPHFYAQLPRSKEAYSNGFRADPIESFDTLEVFVLTDRPGRIYLESGLNSRIFGNVWVEPHAVIFKGSLLTSSFFPFFDVSTDVCGKLEGEAVVRASIEDNPSFTYRLEPSSSTNSWEPLQDWKGPIKRMLDSPDTNMHIGVEQSKLPQSPQVRCVKGNTRTSFTLTLA
jgi:hypothetical protein